MQDIKVCHTCHKILTLDNFRVKPSGMMKTCNECINKRPHKLPIDRIIKPKKIKVMRIVITVNYVLINKINYELEGIFFRYRRTG